MLFLSEGVRVRATAAVNDSESTLLVVYGNERREAEDIDRCRAGNQN